MLVMAVATAFLPVLAWLLVAVRRSARGGPASRPPPPAVWARYARARSRVENS